MANTFDPAALADPPQWLTEACTAPPAQTPQAQPSTRGLRLEVGGLTNYGTTALARHTEAVAKAPEGQRNQTLNFAAYSLGQLAAHIPPDLAGQHLLTAAATCGLPAAEAARTIQSGLTAGQADPYTPDQLEPPAPIPAPSVISPHRLHTDDLAPTKGLSLVTLGDLLADPPEQPPELIEGLIRRGELCVIAAPRAVGKSWLVSNLAILLAAGTGHLFGQLEVVAPARVLLCHGEVDAAEAVRRYQLMIGSPSCPGTDFHGRLVNTFDQWKITLTEKRVNRPQPDGSTITTTHVEALLDGRLEADIEANDIDVLILDPFAVFYAGKENSNDEVEAALAELRRLHLKYGLTIVVVHHFGKSQEGRDPEDLWRGASRMADWASTRVTVTPHYTATQASDRGISRADARRFIDVTFLRRSTPLEDLTAERDLDGWFIPWEPPADDTDHGDHGQPGRPAVVRTRWTPPNIAALLDADGSEWHSLRAASAAMGISKDSAARVLREAVNVGAIVTFDAARGAVGYRLPDTRITPLSDCPKKDFGQ